MAVDKLAQHAREIARAFNITLEESIPPGGRSMANPSKRIVICGPIDTEEAYAVAMHEMGHILHPSGFVRRETGSSGPLREHRYKLHEEDSAWEWARTNALDWSPTMEHVAQVARSTYDTVHHQMEADPIYGILEQIHDLAVRLPPAPRQAPTTTPAAAVKVEQVSGFAGKIKWGKGRG